MTRYNSVYKRLPASKFDKLKSVAQNAILKEYYSYHQACLTLMNLKIRIIYQ